jgi:hypothetical protein
MEKKKSTVRTAIYKKEYTNSISGTFHIFEITFDNNDKGQYFSKSKDQTTFVEGQEVEYTIETKVNGQYTNYSIKPVQAGFVPGKGNPAYEHKRTALKCAVDLCAAGKIELKKINEYSESFMKFLNA